MDVTIRTAAERSIRSRRPAAARFAARLGRVLRMRAFRWQANAACMAGRRAAMPASWPRHSLAWVFPVRLLSKKRRETLVLPPNPGRTHVSLRLSLIRGRPLTRVFTTRVVNTVSVGPRTIVPAGIAEMRAVDRWRPGAETLRESPRLQLRRIGQLETLRQTNRLTHVLASRQRTTAMSDIETPRTLAVAPLQRVFTKSASPVVALAAGSAASQMVPARLEGVMPTSWPTSSAVDVEQLTDKVMLAIDQRLVSARERLGRV